ncbi:hypothetical protein ANN_18052 [Periplaneta americana]|uniref:Major facilitator superfamily domain-containing protein 12-like n=1 Tax=Periplaneta americana TaxID=6978 RepID=A0ABQ8SP14_PERAM|nr:hypothetical protein ANN_18052 [Periplaneta americana]
MEEVKVSNLSISEPNEEHTPLTGSMERSTSTIYRREHHLPLSLRAAYGLGHIFNDISAAMWFSYTLLFLQMVLGMHPTLAGTMLLIGQLADGFATPIVGYMSDRVGSRKAWHITGSILVLVSFPLIFAPCPGCSNSASSSPTWLMAVYYAALIIVFQGAWAVVQISHLAMIPDLTPTQHGRAELTAIRYTASVCSSVAVYIITWCVFHATKGTGLDKIGPDDAFKFRFMRTGSVRDEPRTGRPSISVESVEAIQNAIERSPQASTHRLSRELGIPRSSVWKVLRFTLKKRAYHIQVVHKLEAEDSAARRAMCYDLCEAADWENLMGHILFTDEATFHVCGRVHRHHCCLLQDGIIDTVVLQQDGAPPHFALTDVVITGIVIGIITNSLFHIGLRKVNTQAMQSLIIEHDVPETRRILSYFHSPTLLQVAFLYVTSRLFLTISLVYMPLYLNESLNKGTELIATVPLVCYLSSFTASIGIKYFNNYYGSKLSYLFGAIISISGCLWLRFGMIPQLLTFSIYGVAVFLGAGSSITMVTSLCITADLIGTHTENGAFVYGIVTFADKMLNGIAVMIIENMKCATSGLCPHYYRDILVYVCGSSAVLGLIVLLSLSFVNIGNRRRAGSDILGRSFSTSDTVQSDAQLFCNLPNGIKRSL